MACLCVLFEDLRIEVAGRVAGELAGLDECGKFGKELYFIRRSIATLHEFSMAIRDLDNLPSFQPIKAGFDSSSRIQWTRTVTYFARHDRYIARLLYHVGGHFGRKAAELAITNLMPDVRGALEVEGAHEKEGIKLFFANEIAATGALQHVAGTDIERRSKKLVRHSAVAYRRAIWAVNCITAHYLWQRFGK